MYDEHPVERKKSRWWPPRRGAVRIFPALRVVGALLFIAVGALLFVVCVYYVATLNRKVLLVLGAATVVAAVAVLIRVGQRYEWTGFGESLQPKADDREIQPRKTLWDWLQLFIVPVALAGIGFWFTVQQDSRQTDIEEQRAQDVALQAYLDQMSTLLINHDLGDLEKGSSEVRTLARARTLTVLSRLGGGRKGSVLEFLHEAHLIERNPNIVSLANANLSDVNLSLANLSGAQLSKADLRAGNLVAADLSDTDLSYANLTSANLTSANLSDANLYEVVLTSANLTSANLSKADLRVSNLTHADLSYADLGNANLVAADLSGADLSGADLSGAHLNVTVLSGADLSEADLSDAGLSEAWLEDADLERAEGITEERLEKQGAFLQGATMPDGSKHP